MRGDGPRVEGRRHDDDLEVWPWTTLELQEERESHVPLQVPFVELVEHHGGHAGKQRFGEQAPRQHALGDVAQPGPRAGGVLESHLVSDGLAGPLSHFLRYSPGRGASRQPARLEHHDLARHHREECGRNSRRLSSPSGRLEDQGRTFAEPGEDPGHGLIDGQRFAHQEPHEEPGAR